MKILITGGAGFVGHHVVSECLIRGHHVDVLDCLTYASFGWDRLRNIGVGGHPKLRVYTKDISRPFTEGLIGELGQYDAIIHMAAESHVDRSIENPLRFVETNVIGTVNMLEFARRQLNLKQFIYFSTDEVFGPAHKNTKFSEWDRYNSTNPYAASKAAGEEMALAFANTYDIPVLITHCTNVFGERQHPEKFIPMTVQNLLCGRPVLINADHGLKHIGGRYYIYAGDVADALLFILDRKKIDRGKLNIPGTQEINNLNLATWIAEIMGAHMETRLVDPDIGRHSHDLRYDLDGDKIAKMGWSPPVLFGSKMVRTVKWFMNNRLWLVV